jgi:hypothetical protein
MQRLLQMVALSAFGLFALPRVATACDCASVSPPAHFGPRDVVFVGRVVQSQPLKYVELEVVETFSGRPDRRVRIPIGRSDCDYFLPPVVTTTGTDFLVYASILDDRTLVVNRCSDSGPLNQKTHELRSLRRRAR